MRVIYVIYGSIGPLSTFILVRVNYIGQNHRFTMFRLRFLLGRFILGMARQGAARKECRVYWRYWQILGLYQAPNYDRPPDDHMYNKQASGRSRNRDGATDKELPRGAPYRTVAGVTLRSVLQNIFHPKDDS